MTAALLPEYAASLWLVVEVVECPECEGQGQVEGIRDCWDSSAETHYTEDVEWDCDTCNGTGRRPVVALEEDELRELGYRVDEDGTVYAPRRRRP